MDTREIAQEYRMSHWAQVMQERSESGLSIKSYCQRAGIRENVYYYWQRKLRAAACEEMLPSVRTGVGAQVPQGWAMCEKESVGVAESGIVVEIGQFRVLVGEEVSAEQFEKVCRVLVRLC